MPPRKGKNMKNTRNPLRTIELPDGFFSESGMPYYQVIGTSTSKKGCYIRIKTDNYGDRNIHILPHNNTTLAKILLVRYFLQKRNCDTRVRFNSIRVNSSAFTSGIYLSASDFKIYGEVV